MNVVWSKAAQFLIFEMPLKVGHKAKTGICGQLIWNGKKYIWVVLLWFFVCARISLFDRNLRLFKYRIKVFLIELKTLKMDVQTWKRSIRPNDFFLPESATTRRDYYGRINLYDGSTNKMCFYCVSSINLGLNRKQNDEKMRIQIPYQNFCGWNDVFFFISFISFMLLPAKFTFYPINLWDCDHPEVM